jgi:putative oxidoreductase
MTTCRCEGTEYGKLLVRLVLGSTFIYHGAQKVFGVWGGPGLENFVGHVTGSLGLPAFLGVLAAWFEFGGGLLVFLGVFAEAGAAMIVPVMMVAVSTHWPNGYGSQNKGYEYAFNLLLIAIAVILSGPGKFALWNPLVGWRNKCSVKLSRHGQDAVGRAGEQADGDPEA